MMKLLRRLMRLPIVLDHRGVEKSQHYADIQNGLFTKPVKIGPRASAWPEDEVAALNAARIAGWTDDEIRALVLKLEAARKNMCREVLYDSELEDYREHLAEQRRKQSQGGKTGSSITNSKRNKKTKTVIDDNSSNLSSTSTCNSQVARQVGIESSVQTSKAKPSQNQFSNKRVIADSFVRDYESAEQCTADDYCRASDGY